MSRVFLPCGDSPLRLDWLAGLRGLKLRNDDPKYRFEMSRGFPADSAESGYQRLFARELQKSDMHPTTWLACDCLPGMVIANWSLSTTFGNRHEKPDMTFASSDAARQRTPAGAGRFEGRRRTRSPEAVAAVHVHGLAGHVAGRVGDEELRDRGDVLGVAHAADQRALGNLAPGLFVVVGRHGGIGRSGTHR